MKEGESKEMKMTGWVGVGGVQEVCSCRFVTNTQFYVSSSTPTEVATQQTQESVTSKPTLFLLF